jgi:DNA-binding NtrC family response regulator
LNSVSILIVDDETAYLELLKSLLLQEGFQNVITEDNPKNVIGILQKRHIDLIILDIYMPQMNGLELLEEIYLYHPDIPVIMVTAVDDIDVALQAIKLGAYEFITKPPDADRLVLTINRALDQKLLELERDTLRQAAVKGLKRRQLFGDIVTNSPLMLKVFELVEIFAPTKETVLISGETGTGKDVIAKKIHELSSRKVQPFVVVNLASISPTLFESELFGHVKGSFTGATAGKDGFFEAANGGTIFLDEIGELPKELQGKLLRVIQYGEITKIGNPKPLKLDIRIIAASNKNLLEAVNHKEFRADLYYRLNRGFIHLPPLRERGDDVIELAKYFLKIGNKIYKKHVFGFSNEVLDNLMHHDFPGNVRELENLILNVVAKSSDEEFISTLEIPSAKTKKEVRLNPKHELISLEEAMNNHILDVFSHSGNNIQKAAAILQISDRTLQRRLKNIRDQKK